MRAGRRDRVVTLKEKVVTENDFGEAIETWKDLVKVGDEKDSGSLVEGTLYQVTATTDGYFGDGIELYDVFTATPGALLTSDGEYYLTADGEIYLVVLSVCDSENKVKPVTLPAEIWAQRLDLRGSELWSAKQVIASMSCKYKILYRDDVGPLDILVDGSREYDIQAVLELGRREGLELICSARVN